MLQPNVLAASGLNPIKSGKRFEQTKMEEWGALIGLNPIKSGKRFELNCFDEDTY